MLLFAVVCLFVICGAVLIYCSVCNYGDTIEESGTSMGFATISLVFIGVLVVFVPLFVLLS